MAGCFIEELKLYDLDLGRGYDKEQKKGYTYILLTKSRAFTKNPCKCKQYRYIETQKIKPVHSRITKSLQDKKKEVKVCNNCHKLLN